MLTTPILFIVFNRPCQTTKVFESIQNAKPKKLFIAADGPRSYNNSDIENCKSVRKIVENINWECDVKYLFRDENIGCKLAVSSAINWFFESVEEGIIIEDDCLPNPSFYNFCSILLEKFRNDSDVMHIGGANFQKKSNIIDSYYFSRITHIWGWATWKRAWRKYDVKIEKYDNTVLKKIFKKYNFNKKSFSYWANAFNNVYRNKIDTWDYQWTFTVWMENGIAIIPNENLVSNIGFGNNSTHTNKGGEVYGNLETTNLDNFKHPETKDTNTAADLHTFKEWYTKRTILQRILDRIFKKN